MQRTESVEDRNNLLAQDDHMASMERLAMEVVALERPVPSVMRVTGRISPSDPAPWRRPNIAVRLEVENPEGQRPVSRVYTIRSFDEALSLIEIDFVIHADDSPAMRWLNGAAIGGIIHLVGPRAHYLPDHDTEGGVALFADETAIPAIHAILSTWQRGSRGELYVETADPAAFEELPEVEGVVSHLLLREPHEAAGTTGRLVAAARALPNPEGRMIWAAGERQDVRAIRAYFTEECGLAKEHVRVFGYWRKGVSSSEIDRTRLQQYEAVRAAGGGLRQMGDLDVPA
ncbi:MULTISPECIES: siderophore-interacting protein [Shinella]|uniref:Siderophore-interacting protein n=1 Tax=Shinella sedimenti TaxID=2919913 RepID=A0ABT0CQ77_9HYPH|nr:MULTISPECIES: siderophore-interacting protein [Shinella]MCJ8150732.1 siderophore-interacting protein [Shinella sedimenti]